jgi:hypothetical protein
MLLVKIGLCLCVRVSIPSSNPNHVLSQQNTFKPPRPVFVLDDKRLIVSSIVVQAQRAAKFHQANHRACLRLGPKRKIGRKYRVCYLNR